MNFLRSQKLEKQLQIMNKWTHHQEKSSAYQFKYNTPLHIANTIWDDIEVEKWLSSILQSKSQIEFATALIQAPITDINTLKKRQEALLFLNNKNNLVLTPELEQTCQWALSSQELNKNYLYNVLFPSTWYIRWVRYNPSLFKCYHYYHCYFTCLSSLIYPITVLLGPYWLLTQKLKFPMTFFEYLGYIFKIIKMIKNQYKTNSFAFYKIIIAIVIYVGFYLYSLIQLIDLSIQLHKFRSALCQKIEMIYAVQQKLQELYKSYNHYQFWIPFEPTITEADLFTNIKPNLTCLYNVLTNKAYQEKVHKLYKIATIHDCLITLHRKLKGYNLVKYGDVTYIGKMKNPMLDSKQVSNPIHLEKNLIISGPNAGGKTTYVKSLLWNILLGQSFGVIYGSYGQLKPFDAILHHHRIQDVTGDQSLFQAEMRKIKETITCLDQYQNVIYFLDEPLHSTHPVDGASMLKSLLYYFAEKKNIKLLVTSHYFSIQEVEKDLPDKFVNISVKAVVLPEKIAFNYKLYKGASQQTIGIELLRNQDFPEQILTTATKFKNKIYSQPINV
jgi:hypothetical protein